MIGVGRPYDMPDMPGEPGPGRSSAVRAIVRLVRLPSVLTVPGDVLLGRALAGGGGAGGGAGGGGAGGGLVAASALLYLGGMALNDYADREVDAVERPDRPIPAGDVRPELALALATALTGGALAVAGRVGGTRALRVAVPLVVTVWGYDLNAKQVAAGPPAMALARALNVALGACAAPGEAVDGAALIGAHTLAITLASRREVEGAGPGLPAGVLAAAAGVAAAASVSAGRRRTGGRAELAVSAACLTGYLLSMYDGARGAMRRPGPAAMRRLVGTGVLALMPLQAALLAAAGKPRTAAAVLAAWPVARLGARRVKVT